MKLLGHFQAWLQKNWRMKNWLTRVDTLLETLQNFKTERTVNYSAMSETKAAFADRTIQSLKKILYLYLED